MKYLKMFENKKYNSLDDVVSEIESTLVIDKEEFDNIFLDWKEFIEGKYYSIGNLSMPRFKFHKIDHLNLAKKYSQDIFKDGLNRNSGMDSGIDYSIGDMINRYVRWKRSALDMNKMDKFPINIFDLEEFKNFCINYGIGGWEKSGYDLVIDWKIFTEFKYDWYHDKNEEFLELESILQEVVDRMEQFFGLKYSLFTRKPHGFSIFNIYFYK